MRYSAVNTRYSEPRDITSWDGMAERSRVMYNKERRRDVIPTPVSRIKAWIRSERGENSGSGEFMLKRSHILNKA
jgi:hypothetical protein